MSKSIFSSKTFWINVVLMVAGYVLDNKGVLSDLGLTAHVQIAIVAVANIAMRIVTSKAVTVL